MKTVARDRTMNDFVTRLVSMKAEAGQLGLLRTMHALDGATFQAGYELQERYGDTSAKTLAERARKKRRREGS